MTGDQVREARRLLGWSQGRLAARAKVSQTIISGYERKGYCPLARQDGPDRVAAIRAVFEAAGVEITNEDPPSVRMEKSRAAASSQVRDECLTGTQVRQARELLGISQEYLTRLSGVPANVIGRFERRGHMSPAMYKPGNRIAAVRAALEAAGIEFIPANAGGEVRMRIPGEERPT